MKHACAGKARLILKGREKLWVNPPPGGEGKALLRLAHRANRPQTLNLISGLLENATSFVRMGTTLDRVPEVIIVCFLSIVQLVVITLPQKSGSRQKGERLPRQQPSRS